MLPPDQPFCMTYGDGVAKVNVQNLTNFHRSHGLDATVMVVRRPGRFGAAVIDGHRVTKFMEKPAGDGGYINGELLDSKVEGAVNIATDQAYTLREIVVRGARLCGDESKVQLGTRPHQANKPPFMCASVHRLYEKVDFQTAI